MMVINFLFLRPAPMLPLLLLLLLKDAQEGVRKMGKPEGGPGRKMFSNAVVDGLYL